MPGQILANSSLLSCRPFDWHDFWLRHFFLSLAFQLNHIDCPFSGFLRQGWDLYCRLGGLSQNLRLHDWWGWWCGCLRSIPGWSYLPCWSSPLVVSNIPSRLGEKVHAMPILAAIPAVKVLSLHGRPSLLWCLMSRRGLPSWSAHQFDR